MTNSIIKDIDGISYMHLNLVNYYSNTSQVEFLVNLSKNGFFANKTVYGEKEDLILLQKALSKLISGENITYEYKSMIDEHLSIKFQRNVTGNIAVTCILKDWDYTSAELKLIFNMDQTILCEFCVQLEELFTFIETKI